MSPGIEEDILGLIERIGGQFVTGFQDLGLLSAVLPDLILIHDRIVFDEGDFRVSLRSLFQNLNHKRIVNRTGQSERHLRSLENNAVGIERFLGVFPILLVNHM